MNLNQIIKYNLENEQSISKRAFYVTPNKNNAQRRYQTVDLNLKRTVITGKISFSIVLPCETSKKISYLLLNHCYFLTRNWTISEVKAKTKLAVYVYTFFGQTTNRLYAHT